MNIDLTPIAESGAFRGWLGINPGDSPAFELLGHGEYNINYLFRKPSTGEKLVLRVPMGSQMHLSNQVRYEYEALRLLEPSGRTPKPLYIDDSQTAIPYGFLVMSFLPGRALRYESDLEQAAQCLADIHSLDIPAGSHLISPDNPLAAVLEECFAMSQHYLDSDLGTPDVKHLIRELLKRGQKIVENAKAAESRCLINTELNSGNFLVNDYKTYLVDWEKPLLACPGQDLGHFLAPTTTLWKTDSVLPETEIQSFVKDYCAASGKYRDPDALWAETEPFFVMTCLRGITWSSMAWVEYHSPGRALKDAFTFEKMKYYLHPEFLEMIRKDYLGG
ncbi:MAG: phosphotransferase [Defluviitaleaceae bacterium]|nr:phosphotransferase [Defluviitaleaceae bacterium]